MELNHARGTCTRLIAIIVLGALLAATLLGAEPVDTVEQPPATTTAWSGSDAPRRNGASTPSADTPMIRESGSDSEPETRTVARVRISAAAARRLRITATAVNRRAGGYWVSADAVVVIRGRRFLYAVHGDSYERRKAQVQSREGETLLVRAELHPGERIVTGGAGSVWIIELDGRSAGRHGGER